MAFQSQSKSPHLGLRLSLSGHRSSPDLGSNQELGFYFFFFFKGKPLNIFYKYAEQVRFKMYISRLGFCIKCFKLLFFVESLTFSLLFHSLRENPSVKF